MTEKITEKRAAPGWNVSLTSEALDVLERAKLGRAEKDRAGADSVKILSQSTPPDRPGQRTGLIIGYVQSGKTLSFTTVAALARDHGYQLVIVVAGTSQYLLDQSAKRLERDLNVSSRRWRHFQSPTTAHRQAVQALLDDWQDSTLDHDDRQTVLITVMKNHAQLRDLNELLQQLRLQKVPALVIDDEADQAGLNTRVNQGERSTTYARLSQLRKILPHHTFLQYTATPQANLLINIMDALSPEFVELLTPGEAYTGGRTFFLDKRDELVRSIPVTDIPSKDRRLTEPPASLLQALRLFYLGVSAGMKAKPQNPTNRSMMIHPSQRVLQHAEYRIWVERTQSSWATILRGDMGPEARGAIIDDFRVAFDDLKATVQTLPAFEVLVQTLPRAISRTVITEINAVAETEPPDWDQTYSHILVGGQALDRGFTVEGLTVTYMPRGMGVGNADTFQQRARFFGYKNGYLGYCRVFLEDGIRDAYTRYVKHEESVHVQLRAHKHTGAPLRDWRRRFFLDPAFKPTRSSIIDVPVIRGQAGREWYAPRKPYISPEAVSENRRVVENFVLKTEWLNDEGHERRSENQRHNVAEHIPLRTVFEELLVQLRLPDPEDSEELLGHLLLIGDLLERQPDTACTVFRMSPDAAERRLRSIDASGDVENFFQGANPPTGSAKATVYPGDREIRSADELTFQIHMVDIREQSRGKVIAENVPVVAMWVPSRFATGWVLQDQGTL